MLLLLTYVFFFFSSRRRHTRLQGDWSSDVCSSDLLALTAMLDGDGFFARNAAAATPELNPLLPRPEHFPAKAKSCIFLFMYGGGSEERRVGEKGRFRGAPDHLKKKKRKKERKLCAG